MPAKHAFAEDNSDQWQRKKQTPEQKKAARLAKLDPANWKSAKDVYDARSAEAAKKRKREDGDADNDVDEQQGDQVPPSKKQKSDGKKKVLSDRKITEKGVDEAIENPNLKKKLKKRANRLEKNQKERERREAELAKSQNAEQDISIDMTGANESVPDNKPDSKSSKKEENKQKQSESAPMQEASKPIKISKKDSKTAPGTVKASKQDLAAEEETSELPDEEDWESESDQDDEENQDEDSDQEMSDAASTATSSEAMPDILSPVHDSASSSVSSIQPPAQTQDVKPKSKAQKQAATPSESANVKPVQSEAEREAARQRLQSQISQFRSQRKADSKPVQTRAELLEQRRRKEAERKAAKKEQRRKEKEEEARKQDEEIARRFSPGGSVTGSLLGSPRSPMIDDDSGANAFTFGRIAFADGSSFDPTTKQAADAKKRKGPSDTASALKAAQAKQGRIAGLDDEKKADIAEKDMWLNARKRAHGEKVKDDTSLLKKALKRQDKEKKKSETEWTKRTEGVQAAQDAKQKRRTENLQKRKEEKGSKGSKVSKGKKPKRAGFEGSFKGRSGKNKK